MVFDVVLHEIHLNEVLVACRLARHLIFSSDGQMLDGHAPEGRPAARL